MNRRDFLKATAGSALCAAVGQGVVYAGRRTAKQSRGLIHDRSTDPPLEFAETAPDPSVNWAMAIDSHKCIGCHACSAACRNEFDVPPGVWKSWVKVVSHSGQKLFLPRLCNHCDSAPCIAACPVQALYRREDGLVLVRYDRCIGCKACVVACPYGALFVNPRTATVDKCTFCAHRLDQGRPPACVEACPTRARISGDLNDPESEVVKLARSPDAQVLKPELATGCKVFYLNASPLALGRVHLAAPVGDTVQQHDKSIPGPTRDAFEQCRRTVY